MFQLDNYFNSRDRINLNYLAKWPAIGFMQLLFTSIKQTSKCALDLVETIILISLSISAV
jgi:hypothetical protein